MKPRGGTVFGVFLPARLETRLSGHPFFGHPGGGARCGPRKKERMALFSGGCGLWSGGCGLVEPQNGSQNLKRPIAGVALLLSGGCGLGYSWEKGRLVMGKKDV